MKIYLMLRNLNPRKFDLFWVTISLINTFPIMKLSAKKNERYDEIVRYLRVKLSFLALKSTLLCLRGSRSTFKANDVDCDFGLTLNELGL